MTNSDCKKFILSIPYEASGTAVEVQAALAKVEISTIVISRVSRRSWQQAETIATPRSCRCCFVLVPT